MNKQTIIFLIAPYRTTVPGLKKNRLKIVNEYIIKCFEEKKIVYSPLPFSLGKVFSKEILIEYFYPLMDFANEVHVLISDEDWNNSKEVNVCIELAQVHEKKIIYISSDFSVVDLNYFPQVKHNKKIINIQKKEVSYQPSKICIDCNKEKLLTLFHNRKASPDGKSFKCIECWDIKRKNFYSKNPSLKDNRLKKNYGITLSDYNNMLVQQNNSCFICKTPFEEITSHLLHVDHSHITGKVRKLLCNKCNHTLGLLKDDISYAQNCINYLIKHQ